MVTVLLLFCVLDFHIQIINAACSVPLGLSTGEIKDWQITASSIDEQRKEQCQANYIRLYSNSNNRAWCPRTDQPHQWIQIDLGTPTKLHGFMTQGRPGSREWITSLLISHSLDYYQWNYITDSDGDQNIFTANHDAVSIRYQYFRIPFNARFIRFHIVSWHLHPSLRLELVGCQECNKPLVFAPYTRFSASSSVPTRYRATCQPRDAFLLSNKGWCARYKQITENWLQIDIGHPTRVTALVTKGRGDRGEQWVTKYILAFSNDSRLWVYYNDARRTVPKIFNGNYDKSLERIHYLNQPFTARFVRFFPKEWNNRLSMRAGLLGCPHTGPCCLGYFRVQPEIPCVENLAHRKSITLNDLTHPLVYSSPQTILSYLIDGYDSSSRCTTIDSTRCKNGEPHIIIDLNRNYHVHGVIIQQLDSFSHLSQDDYLSRLQLDRIIVYITLDMSLASHQYNTALCSLVTRKNYGILSQRIHLQCQTPIMGRFIHIQLLGMRTITNRTQTRFSLPFKAHFCEIYAYN
ncbi:unnamed protein product [Rotaria sp. Silwood1]|nr:unnamed protein product [Rotaria sp. Silwood1]CAF1606362.1 unnamed protein product [Rotaria sp. Silwood1]CAF3682538.1 unnamed protein product [Rotaria sp. Silwood1]CAF3713751.1 unnamed protein product [Rotaria sp. Silwood1]CAF3725893.1 unnamed protein product [Rotaria sp. Silwood1]